MLSIFYSRYLKTGNSKGLLIRFSTAHFVFEDVDMARFLGHLVPDRGTCQKFVLPVLFQRKNVVFGAKFC